MATCNNAIEMNGVCLVLAAFSYSSLRSFPNFIMIRLLKSNLLHLREAAQFLKMTGLTPPSEARELEKSESSGGGGQNPRNTLEQGRGQSLRHILGRILKKRN